MCWWDEPSPNLHFLHAIRSQLAHNQILKRVGEELHGLGRVPTLEDVSNDGANSGVQP